MSSTKTNTEFVSLHCPKHCFNQMFASLHPILQLCGTNSLSGRVLWHPLSQARRCNHPRSIPTCLTLKLFVTLLTVQVFRWREVQAWFCASGWCVSMEVICSPQSPAHQPRALRGNCTQIQSGQPVFAFQGLQLGSRFLRNFLPIVLVLILCHSCCWRFLGFRIKAAKPIRPG